MKTLISQHSARLTIIIARIMKYINQTVALFGPSVPYFHMPASPTRSHELDLKVALYRAFGKQFFTQATVSCSAVVTGLVVSIDVAVEVCCCYVMFDISTPHRERTSLYCLYAWALSRCLERLSTTGGRFHMLKMLFFPHAK